jgi:hypothetical protein
VDGNDSLLEDALPEDDAKSELRTEWTNVVVIVLLSQ